MDRMQDSIVTLCWQYQLFNGQTIFPHCWYNSPSFLKKLTPLSAGCRSAALLTPFNVLSVSCNVFNVSPFMFNKLSCDLTCGGLAVLYA